jgi:hypothetical protein
MADSPVSAASSPRPEAHEETETESEFNFEKKTDSEPEHDSKRDLGSVPGPEATTAGSDETNGDAGEGGNQDAASVKTLKTTTTDLLNSGLDEWSAPEPKQRKLGLDINEPLGWNGSSYNDYE